MSSSAIVAAGGVLWRPSRKHGIKVGVIHRERHDDWSLPKGKAKRGESLATTAVREVAEETGMTVQLGRYVSGVRYRVPSGRKRVHYFSARAIDGRFAVNDEVDRIDWLPVPEARERLSYQRDRAVLTEFALLPADMTMVLVIRHASAGDRKSYQGADADRPLDDKGTRQAKTLADQLVAFRPRAAAAAPLVRCRRTIRPLAKKLGVPVSEEQALSERAYECDAAAAERRVIEMAGAPNAPIAVCSQGGVIPGVITNLAKRSGIAVPDVGTPKAAYWVLSFDKGRLRQADRYLLGG